MVWWSYVLVHENWMAKNAHPQNKNRILQIHVCLAYCKLLTLQSSQMAIFWHTPWCLEEQACWTASRIPSPASCRRHHSAFPSTPWWFLVREHYDRWWTSVRREAGRREGWGCGNSKESRGNWGCGYDHWIAIHQLSHSTTPGEKRKETQCQVHVHVFSIQWSSMWSTMTA